MTARFFVVEVDDDADFSSPFLRKKTSLTRVSVPERLADGTYFWRVKSISDSGEESLFSPPSSFTVIPTFAQWVMVFTALSMALMAGWRMRSATSH